MRAKLGLVGFDLDGTLVDSLPDLSACVSAGLTAVGRPPAPESDTRRWVGSGIEVLVRRALSHGGEYTERELEAALTHFDACYAQRLFTSSRVYADVDATLQVLGAAGLVLCCVTNKRHAYAVRLLELAGLARHFAFVFGGDTFAAQKPDPQPLLEAARRTRLTPRQCVLVGDSQHDYDAAAAAEFGFVWATYGYGDWIAATDQAPYVPLERFADLVAVLGIPC